MSGLQRAGHLIFHRRVKELPASCRNCAQKKAAPSQGRGFEWPALTQAGDYSPIVSNDALPPAAVVLTVSVRSPAKRSR